MLKNYLSLPELMRDLRKIRRSVQSTIASDDVDGDEEPAFKTVKIRDADKKPSITERFQKTDKASREHGREVARNSKRLRSLLDQQRAINNITHSLNTEFANSDYTNLTRMKQIAERIKQDVDTSVKTTTKSLGELAKKTAPAILFSLANRVDQKLQQKIGKHAKSHETVTLTATVNDTPQYTIYLIYHNLKNDSGYTFPNKIFAISLYNDKLYVNFQEPTLKPPGHFPIGLEVPIHAKELSQTTDIIMKRVDAQLEADDNISGMKPMPLPMETNSINLKNIRNVAKFSIHNNEIVVLIDKSVGNEARAVDVVNSIQLYLFAGALQANQRTKLRIVHSDPKKVPGGYSATFKFIPGGKYSGITLKHETTKQLRELGFSESAINRLFEEY
jgi:hypothetical protein